MLHRSPCQQRHASSPQRSRTGCEFAADRRELVERGPQVLEGNAVLVERCRGHRLAHVDHHLEVVDHGLAQVGGNGAIPRDACKANAIEHDLANPRMALTEQARAVRDRRSTPWHGL
jgi:hypothetical protein